MISRCGARGITQDIRRDRRTLPTLHRPDPVAVNDFFDSFELNVGHVEMVYQEPALD
jgi:hypothetical protein